MSNEEHKMNDTEVRIRQEKKWIYFEKKIRRSFLDEPEGLEENLELAHGFLLGKIKELPYSSEFYIMRFGYVDWILMHPNPDQETIRNILDDFIAKGYVERKPYVTHARELSGHCEYLIEENLVDKSVISDFMDVVYGNSIEETIARNKVDFDSAARDMLSSFLAKIISWAVTADTFAPHFLTPIDRWLVLVKGLLLKVENKHVEDSSHRLRKFFTLLSGFETRYDRNTDKIKVSEIARNKSVVTDLRRELVSSKDKYCEALREYVSELEVALEQNKIKY